jgi:hypothetical protein
MGTPLAAFALAQFDEEAFSQTSNAGAPPDVVDFWVDHMGVPAHMVLGAETTRGRRAQAGPQTSNLAREPLFLHYDPDEGSLIPADQIPSAKMHPFTDAKMDFQLVRMRLNPADHQQFSNYTSGGIYLDFQQGQPQSIFGELVSLATTSFSAIFPGAKSGAGASSGSKSGSKSGGKSASSGTSSGASKSPAAAPAAAAAAPAASIPLQAAKQSQSLTLPGGMGKTSFACFAKDPRKTLFGSFVDVMSKVVNSPLVSYLPLMSFPVVGSMGLAGIKGLVGSLQGLSRRRCG